MTLSHVTLAFVNESAVGSSSASELASASSLSASCQGQFSVVRSAEQGKEREGKVMYERVLVLGERQHDADGHEQARRGVKFVLLRGAILNRTHGTH